MAPLKPERGDRLSAPCRRAVAALGEAPFRRQVYLAGSAALTLYLGHRRVASLDLMAADNRLGSAARRDLLAALLEIEPATRVETARDGYLFVRFGEVPLRLYHYPYALIEPAQEISGLAVASPVDLGLMKLGAIISRGSRRDFVDLYLLCRVIPLERLLERAPEKFVHVRDFPLQALKGLADLSQTDGDPMPALAVPLAWEEVEAWLDARVRELGRARVGLAGDRG